jgi:hypothetical protein
MLPRTLPWVLLHPTYFPSLKLKNANKFITVAVTTTVALVLDWINTASSGKEEAVLIQSLH